MAHIYNGILLSHQKKRNWVMCSEVDGPTDCHTEWSKSDTEKPVSYDTAYMWNLKKKKKEYKWNYLQNRSKVMDVENKLMVTRVEGEGRDKLGDWDWHIHTAIY